VIFHFHARSPAFRPWKLWVIFNGVILGAYWLLNRLEFNGTVLAGWLPIRFFLVMVLTVMLAFGSLLLAHRIVSSDAHSATADHES